MASWVPSIEILGGNNQGIEKLEASGPRGATVVLEVTLAITGASSRGASTGLCSASLILFEVEEGAFPFLFFFWAKVSFNTYSYSSVISIITLFSQEHR